MPGRNTSRATPVRRAGRPSSRCRCARAATGGRSAGAASRSRARVAPVGRREHRIRVVDAAHLHGFNCWPRPAEKSCHHTFQRGSPATADDAASAGTAFGASCGTIASPDSGSASIFAIASSSLIARPGEVGRRCGLQLLDVQRECLADRDGLRALRRGEARRRSAARSARAACCRSAEAAGSRSTASGRLPRASTHRGCATDPGIAAAAPAARSARRRACRRAAQAVCRPGACSRAPARSSCASRPSAHRAPSGA